MEKYDLGGLGLGCQKDTIGTLTESDGSRL